MCPIVEVQHIEKQCNIYSVRNKQIILFYLILKHNIKNVKIEYCGQPSGPRVNVLGRRPTGLNFESCVWRAVSPHSYHHPQEVLLAQLSLYVHKCGVKPHSFHFIVFDTAN